MSKSQDVNMSFCAPLQNHMPIFNYTHEQEKKSGIKTVYAKPNRREIYDLHRSATTKILALLNMTLILTYFRSLLQCGKEELTLNTKTSVEITGV